MRQLTLCRIDEHELRARRIATYVRSCQGKDPVPEKHDVDAFERELKIKRNPYKFAGYDRTRQDSQRARADEQRISTAQ